MNKQKVLLVMAHGSRKHEANEEFLALVDTLNLQGLPYSRIKACFLEIAVPDLETVVAQSLNDNNHYFDLYPLFLNQGNHVVRDIPAQIDTISEKYPLVNIRQLDYLGSKKRLVQLLVEHILEQA